MPQTRDSTIDLSHSRNDITPNPLFHEYFCLDSKYAKSGSASCRVIRMDPGKIPWLTSLIVTMLPFVSFTWSPGWSLSALTHVRRLFILSRQGYEVDCMVSNAAPAFTYIQINQYSSQAVKIFELLPFWKVWLTKRCPKRSCCQWSHYPDGKGSG